MLIVFDGPGKFVPPLAEIFKVTNDDVYTSGILYLLLVSFLIFMLFVFANFNFDFNRPAGNNRTNVCRPPLHTWVDPPNRTNLTSIAQHIFIGLAFIDHPPGHGDPFSLASF